MIDTHCHIYSEEFDIDRDDAMRRAWDAGVTRMLLPAIDSQTHGRLLQTCVRYDCCLPMMGLHPTSVNDNPEWRRELAAVEEYLKNPPTGRFYAVGEIGLDFYWSADFKKEQTEAFRRQAELAIEYGLPVVIHTRDAWPEMTAEIERYKASGLRGVLHAFSDTLETYERLAACGDFCFGIGGVVTFKKSPLAEVVRQMDMDRILLETDCPYLTPAPYRGKRNEPAYIRYICDRIAELKSLSPDEVARATTSNAGRIFATDER